MSYTAVGVTLNIIMFIVLVIIIGFGISYQVALNSCENTQSPFCYTISCPCDDTSAGPCFGYAKKPSGNGNWYCSNAPSTEVNNFGRNV